MEKKKTIHTSIIKKNKFQSRESSINLTIVNQIIFLLLFFAHVEIEGNNDKKLTKHFCQI